MISLPHETPVVKPPADPIDSPRAAVADRMIGELRQMITLSETLLVEARWLRESAKHAPLGHAPLLDGEE